MPFGAGLAFGRLGAPWLYENGLFEPFLALVCCLIALGGGFFEEREPEQAIAPPEAPKTGEPSVVTHEHVPPEGVHRGGDLVVIFGASTRTGICLVRRALAAGFRVRAFARSPSKLQIKHDKLEVVHGDVADDVAVRAAMTGASVAICVASSTQFGSKYPVGLMRRFIRSAVAGMREHGVRRLIYQASSLCYIPGEEPSLPKRLARATVFRAAGMMPVIDENDSVLEYLFLSAQDLSWAVTMPSILREQPSKGGLECKKDFPGVHIVSHDDMAELTLAVANDDRIRGFTFVGYSP